MIEYSVVIPTFNRLDVLPEVLEALEQQEAAPSYEIVVVDDGSTDGTGPWLQQWLDKRHSSVLAIVHRQENQGPAHARNWGVQKARGARVAFLGDDTVPSTGWLRAHQQAVFAARRRFGDDQMLGVLGYTGWHPRMKLDPFLRYINDYGLQFGYALIEDADNVPFNFLYTSNLSLPRQALVDDPFDLGFPYPAWEDIELAYRLTRRGLRLVYEPSATAAHDHPTTLKRFMTRQEKAGFSAVVFHQLHPELGSFLGLGPDGPPAMPPVHRQRWRERLARLLQHFRMRTPRLWEDVLRFYYIAGLHRGWQERVVEQQGKENPPNVSQTHQ